MMNFLMVGIGGSLGAMTRYLMNDLIKRRWPSSIFLATLLVNVSGSFLLGFLLSFNLDNWTSFFFGIGFLGAYTTFSTFTLESLNLLLEKKAGLFLFYQISTYAGGIVAASLGFILAKII